MSENGGSPMSGREEEPNGAPVERERSVSRDRSRERSRERSKKEKHSRRDRDSSREHRSRRDRSRSRSRDRKRRSRSRDRHRRRRSRSRSRDRRGSRQRSSSRGRGRRSDRRRSRSRSGSRDSMGGYKPRRRQEPAKPAAASMFATNDPYAHLRSKVSSDPAEAMRLWQEQMLKSRQLVLAQQAKSAVQQANKAQRELYIGNLTPGAVTDAMLSQVFDSALIAAFPQAAAPGQEPVCRVNIHSDGRYGFVEFRSPEYASAALQLNGQINLMGQALAIGRPASYVDPNKVHQAAAQAEAALAAFQSGGALPMAAIGAAEALLPGSAGANMAAAGNAAAAGHNEAAMAAGTVTAASLAAAAAAAAGGPFPGPPGAAAAGAVGPSPPASTAGAAALLVTEAGASAVPTPYLVVSGMITPEVLADSEEYEEVLLDLQEECGKHGAVYEVKVPRPANPKAAGHLFGTGNYGKAYVQFVDTSGATKAREAIHGRMFAGNPVSAVYLTAQAYGVAMAAMDADKQQQ